jgi:hypothetical protein
MYWSRTDNLIDIALYLLLSAGWALGGYILVKSAFQLRRIERVVAGLAVGYLLFIGLSNLFAHILPVSYAFWAASSSIFLAGIAGAWKVKLPPWLEKRDFYVIPLIIIMLVLTALFTLILRGESIFDEYLHLPLISIMAAGDIPPRFYLNPDLNFAYHYGIHVFAASLVRLAGLFPWSAWDISRAFTIAFTLVLGWLWVRRVTRSLIAAWIGTILITFGGGARWLLLLLPAGLSIRISQSIDLVGTGFDTAPTLIEALQKTWLIEGAGKANFPFAFHNGIFIPVFFNLGSSGALPFMTILLLLLLLPRRRFSSMGVIIWALLFSTLALSAEHLFALVWIGIALTAVMALLFRQKLFKTFPKDICIQWVLILSLSAILSLIQGGFVTETARNLVASLTGSAFTAYNARGFSLRWPPGLLSAHLGTLSIFNPQQLFVLLAELGLALLLVPVIFIRFARQLRQQNWFLPSLSTSVMISLVFPLFFQYEVDRSITRMPATALWTCLVIGFPLLWMTYLHSKIFTRLGLAFGYILLILGGMVIFASQLRAVSYQELSYYIDDLDAGYSMDYWDKLPVASQVLDRIPERSVTIFGRISRAGSGIYSHLPEWEALIADPVPARIVSAGFDYVYMDRVWWDNLTPAQRVSFQQPCIDIIEERKQNAGFDYRLLISLIGCR